MKRILKEDCLLLSIYDLKRSKVFEKSHYSGLISWNNQGTCINNLSILVNRAQKYIDLKYWLGGYNGNNEELIEYRVTLTTSICNYGRERYWFSCPNYQNKHYCNKKVAILYLAPNKHQFICRHCLNLSYKSRNINNRSKFASLDRMLSMERVVNKLKSQVKTRYRKTWPTKKYRKLMRANKKLKDAIDIVSQNMDDILRIDKKSNL